MFMQFRGGGIGHKVTWEWDGFLQCKGCDPPLDNEDIVNDLESEDSKSADELKEIGIEMGDGIGEEREDSELDESEDEEDDIIVADKGEELDKGIWAQEWYGPL